MITHIRMKNFKAWKDSGEVKLAPLTGFFGTNSSGKSSLLQMLLLLKQTVERADSEEVLFFGDEDSYVNLGSFAEVIHGHIEDGSLVFELQCILTHPRSNFNIPIDGSLWKQKIDRFSYECIIHQNEFSKTTVDKLTYGPSLKNSPEIVCNEGRMAFPNRNEADSTIELKNCYGQWSSGSTKSIMTLQKYVSAFEELFSHVFYLGPNRVNPQRIYSWSGGHPQHIKQWGNQTIDALLSARVRKLRTLLGTEVVPIDDKISDWLQKMDLAHSFELDLTNPRTTNYEVRIQKTPSSPPVTLVDMGYGLAQFLPVLVLCYYAPEGSTLILEQPGIHLHPKVQSQLADLLIEVVNERKLQILVESHSEHLLNRLQRRIAEEQINVDQTALYFCRNENGVSDIERLDVDEFGNISNWPENFFGNDMGDLYAMNDAQRKRRKSQES